MYHYLYKICNNITGEFYYGVHSTENLNDGYFGSGIELKRNIKKYGRDNFSMHILEYKETRDEVLMLEQTIVNPTLLKDPLCLNLSIGGNGCPRSPGRATVRDMDGNCFTVPKNDPRIKSGELESINKGNRANLGKIAITKNGTDKYCNPEELESYLADGWVRGGKSRNKGRKLIKNIQTNKYASVYNNDPRLSSPEWLIAAKVLPSKIKGRINIHKQGSIKRILPNELESYLANGWVRGTGINPHKR